MSELPYFENLRATLSTLAPLTDDEWQSILPRLSVKHFGKDDFLLRAGEVDVYCCFVAQGLLRLFYSTIDGKEFNKSFVAENGIAGSLTSVITGAASRFSIQALEPTTIVLIPIASMYQLVDQYRNWETIARRFVEHLALKKEKREASFLLDNAKQRYADFKNEFHAIEHRINQYHIASYLGITDVALSRIRRRR